MTVGQQQQLKGLGLSQQQVDEITALNIDWAALIAIIMKILQLFAKP